jgi:RNA polymerase sigma factor (sigma-70 family)
MRKYSNKVIGELASELCCGLKRLRKGYVDAAEEMIKEIVAGKDYPYEFIVFRLTGYRPKGRGLPRRAVSGKSLHDDLIALMLDISESFELKTSDYAEKVFDTAALAKQFDVSTKTVQRWRKKGLPARRMIFPDEKRRIGFLESSVRWFNEQHKNEMQRSSKFSQMTEQERWEIIRKAKRMAKSTGSTLSDIARHIAKRSGRSVETIRYTIRRYDSETPDSRIFPRTSEPLGDKEKWYIFRSFLSGVPVPDLAKQYNRTRGSIYRIINELRAAQLIERPISYISNECFKDKSLEKEILADLSEIDPDQKPHVSKPPAGLPPYLRSLYEIPLLTVNQERHLFRKYNYLKYAADKLRKEIDVTHVSSHQVKEIEGLLLQANLVKNRIVRSNLRLVVSIAKKHVHGPLSLFELISDGNLSLMRAVEKFDYGKGYRFSTYASWAIIRNYARSVPREKYQLDRFSTGHEELLDIATSLRSYNPAEDNPYELRESIDTLLDHLSPRERTILVDHYGLEEDAEPKTFEQLGNQLGISKERVRQIEIQAINKLKDIAEPFG